MHSLKYKNQEWHCVFVIPALGGRDRKFPGSTLTGQPSLDYSPGRDTVSKAMRDSWEQQTMLFCSLYMYIAHMCTHMCMPAYAPTHRERGVTIHLVPMFSVIPTKLFLHFFIFHSVQPRGPWHPGSSSGFVSPLKQF